MSTTKASITQVFRKADSAHNGNSERGEGDTDSFGKDRNHGNCGDISATYAEFLPTGSGGHFWSDPGSWADGKVPTSSKELHIRLDDLSVSRMDLGTAQDVFVAADVLSAGVGFNELIVQGFLRVQDIDVQRTIVSGNLLITRSTGSTPFDVVGTGTLEIKHDIGQSTLGFHGVGPREFGNDATIILDEPPKSSFNNSVYFSGNLVGPSPVLSQKIELGGLRFDHADFVPNPSTPNPGTSDQEGRLELTNHGRLVYEMTNVFSQTGGTFSVGSDSKTCYDYVAWSHT
jgi:hypothetical protein